MAGYQKLDVVVANVNTTNDDVSEAGLTQGGKTVVPCPYVPDTHHAHSQKHDDSV